MMNLISELGTVALLVISAIAAVFFLRRGRKFQVSGGQVAAVLWTLIIITILVMIGVGTAYGQTDTVRVQFAPSQYSVDYDVAVPEGKIVKVVGVANSLYNRNGMKNAELAQKRADAFGFDSSVEHEAIVFNSDRAEHRAVWIIVDTSIDEPAIIELETQWKGWERFRLKSLYNQNQRGVEVADSAKFALDSLIRRSLKGYDVEVPSTPASQRERIEIETLELEGSNVLDSISPSAIPCACEVMKGKTVQELEALAKENLSLARELGSNAHFRRAKLANRQAAAQRKAERKSKKRHKKRNFGGAGSAKGSGRGDWTNGNLLIKIFPMLSCKR